jgi:hypothetical protein
MSTSNSNIKYKISITQNSQNIANNTSNVTVKVTCYRTNTGYTTTGSGTCYCIINGTTYSEAITSSDKITNSGVVLFSKTLNIPHNDSGAKTLTCQAKITHSQFSSDYQSFSTALTFIPRETTISCVNGNIGSAVSITLNRKSTSAFKHNISYSLYDYSTYQFISGAAGSVATNINAATYSWTIPTSFYQYIPNAKKVRCKLTVETTYNGDTVGMSSCEIICSTVESACKPTLSPTVTDADTAIVAITGDANKLLKYYSNPTYNAGAAARNSATIKSISVVCGSETKTTNTGTFYNVTSNTFKFTVTDSRGYTTTQTVTKTMINYIKLTCNLKVTPPAATEDSLWYTISGNYFNGSIGNSANTLKVEYRYKVNDGEYSAWTTATATLSGNTYTIEGFVMPVTYQDTTIFQVRASDLILKNISATKTVKTTPIFDWGENDFKFNVPVYTADGLCLSGAAKALTNSYTLETTVTKGSNYSTASTSNAVLLGNNLRCYIAATRSSAPTAGNIANEVVASMSIKHGGKIKASYITSFTNGSTGGVSSFSLINAENDGETLSFDITLAATTTTDTGLATYFIIPCVLNLEAY